jgi:hypothetical protein
MFHFAYYFLKLQTYNYMFSFAYYFLKLRTSNYMNKPSALGNLTGFVEPLRCQ